jgi:acyl-CoA synthetase (AMP-forming)/AMP-acid ligase II
MFHSYGLHAYILRATLFPATYVIMERWNTSQYLRSIPKEVLLLLATLLANTPLTARYRVTNLTLVPSTVHQLVNHAEIKTTDLSSVVQVTSGAAHLPPELGNRILGFMKKDSVLFQGAPPRPHPLRSLTCRW